VSFSSNRFARHALIDQPIKIVPIQTFVPFEHLLPFFLGHVSDMRNPGNHEVVDPEKLRNTLSNVCIEAIDRSAHNNNGGHPDDDPDEGEKRTKFVSEYRLKGDLRSVGIE